MPSINPELVVATISAAMQAMSLWAQFRDRQKALTATREVENLMQTQPIIEEGERLQQLVPDDVLNAMQKRVSTCWTNYKEVIESTEYLPKEIDEATEALKACICRELRRIHSINGSIPEGNLSHYWNQYKCQTIK